MEPGLLCAKVVDEKGKARGRYLRKETLWENVPLLPPKLIIRFVHAYTYVSYIYLL